MMQAAGNAVAAFGGSGEVLNRIIFSLGQIRSRGFAMGDEIRELAAAGIPVWDMLSQAMGKPVAQLQKMSENRQITADTFMRAFQQYSQTRFGDMMQAQSQTFQGALSNVADGLDQAIARGFRPFFVLMSQGTVQAGNFLTGDQFVLFTFRVQSAAQSLVNFGGQAAAVTGQIAGTAAPIAAVGAAFVVYELGAVRAASAIRALAATEAVSRVAILGIGGAARYTALEIGAFATTAAGVAAIIAGVSAVVVGLAYAWNQLTASMRQIDPGIWRVLTMGALGTGNPVGQISVAIDEFEKWRATQAAPQTTEGFVGPLEDPAVTALNNYKNTLTAAGDQSTQYQAQVSQAASANYEVAASAVTAVTATDMLKASLDMAQGSAANTREQLSKAQADLNRFASAPLAGERAIEMASGGLNMQIAQLEAQKAQAQLARLDRRPVRAGVRGIDQQIERLRLQQTILRPQELAVQQQRDSLRALASEPALSYQAAVAGIQASKAKVEQYTKELAVQEAIVKAKEAEVAAAEAAAKVPPRTGIGSAPYEEWLRFALAGRTAPYVGMGEVQAAGAMASRTPLEAVTPAPYSFGAGIYGTGAYGAPSEEASAWMGTYNPQISVQVSGNTITSPADEKSLADKVGQALLDALLQATSSQANAAPGTLPGMR